MVRPSSGFVKESDEHQKEIDEKIKKQQEILAKEASELEQRLKQIIKKSRRLRRKAKFYREQLNRRYTGPANRQITIFNYASLKKDLKNFRNEKVAFNDRKKKFLEDKKKFGAWKDEALYARFKREIQDEFEVTLADKSTHQALLFAFSSKYDLALLKIQGRKTPYLDYKIAENVARGLPVYAIGSPLRPEYHNAVTSESCPI